MDGGAGPPAPRARCGSLGLGDELRDLLAGRRLAPGTWPRGLPPSCGGPAAPGEALAASTRRQRRSAGVERPALPARSRTFAPPGSRSGRSRARTPAALLANASPGLTYCGRLGVPHPPPGPRLPRAPGALTLLLADPRALSLSREPGSRGPSGGRLPCRERAAPGCPGHASPGLRCADSTRFFSARRKCQPQCGGWRRNRGEQEWAWRGGRKETKAQKGAVRR